MFFLLFFCFCFFSPLEAIFQPDRVLKDGNWKLEVVRSVPERFSRLSYIESNGILSLSFHSFFSEGSFYFFCEIHSFCEWMNGEKRDVAPAQIEICWGDNRTLLEGVLEVGSQKIWLTPASNQVLISLILKNEKIKILRGTNSLDIYTKGFYPLYYQFCKM